MAEGRAPSAAQMSQASAASTYRSLDQSPTAVLGQEPVALEPDLNGFWAVGLLRRRCYFFAFLACRFSFSVFCAGFFSMLFFVFLSLVAMLYLPCGCG